MLSVGIHIRENSVYFVGSSLNGNNPKIDFLEEHFFTNLKQEDEKALFISRWVEKIQTEKKGVSLRFCYVLSQNFVTSFFAHFPFKEKFKVMKTLPFEVENQSPFSSNQVSFDARICGLKNKKESRFLCFVTLKENLEDFLNFTKPFSHKPYLLSCEISALANLVETWNRPLSQIQNPTSRQCYLYLGTTNSQFLFYRGGHLEYISVLDWSIKPLIKDMEKFYGLNTEQSFKEFFEKAFVLTSKKGFSKDQVFFSDLIKKKVQKLRNQIQLLKLAFESEKKEQMDQVFLFGPGSVIKNITAFLTAETSINFSRLKKLESFPVFDFHGQASFLVALGLSLEGLKRSPYGGINFLRPMKESFFLFPKKWKKSFVFLFTFFLIFTLYTVLRNKETFKVHEKIQPVFINFVKKIAWIEDDEIQAQKVQSFLDRKKKENQSEEFIRKQLSLPGPMDKIKILTERLQEADKWDLKIVYLKVEENQIHIKGSLNVLFLSSLKSQIKTLALGPIKELGFRERLDLKDGKKSSQKQQLTKHSIKASQNKEKPLNIQDQSINFKKEKRAFFSYIFKMKEDL